MLSFFPPDSDVFSLFPASVHLGLAAGEEWRLLRVSPSLAALLGREDAAGQTGQAPRPCGNEFIGQSLLTFFKRMGYDHAADVFASVSPGEMATFTAKNRRFAMIWNRLAPDRRFFFFHALPVDHAFAERELLTKELQVIMDSMHDGIWVIDGEGNTVHVNQAMQRIADIDPADVIGRHVTAPMHEGKFTSCVTLTALEQGKPVTMFDDYSCGTRCLNTSTPILDADGKIWRVVASIRDMTELERLQKRLAEAEREAHLYRDRLDDLKRRSASGFMADSEAMRQCLRKLEKAAGAPSAVLLLGETGTGKTLAASLIHKKSERRDGAFVSVNCAAIPENLIESELFGYAKGAFTGASQSGKKGYFEQADGGTLFLDEIGELPLSMQAKLLHVLDNQTFHKVGGEKAVKVDVRMVAATNKPLEELVAAGQFRDDLYYRLRVLSVRLPPLREHPEDIPMLAMAFLDEACSRHGTVKTLSPAVLRCFAAQPWPGNVRELRAAVEFLAAMSESSCIGIADLPPYILACHCLGDEDDPDDDTAAQPGQRLKEAVDALEFAMIRDALQRCGSTYKAAASLGVSQSTVVRKARQLGIRLTEQD